MAKKKPIEAAVGVPSVVSMRGGGGGRREQGLHDRAGLKHGRFSCQRGEKVDQCFSWPLSRSTSGSYDLFAHAT